MLLSFASGSRQTVSQALAANFFLIFFLIKFKGRKKNKGETSSSSLGRNQRKVGAAGGDAPCCKASASVGGRAAVGSFEAGLPTTARPDRCPRSALTCDPSRVEVSRSACLAREGKQVSRRCIPLIIHQPLVDTFTSENIYGPGSVSRVHNSCAYICTQAHY